jgi:excisionase family DNA binding protein
MDKLLSIPEAAGVFSVSEGAVKKWLCHRRLPRVKLGRLTRLRACDVDAVTKSGLPPKGTYPREIRNPATKGLPASGKSAKPLDVV